MEKESETKLTKQNKKLKAQEEELKHLQQVSGNIHYCSKVWGHLEMSLVLEEKHIFGHLK